jgi:hypothetical protein
MEKRIDFCVGNDGFERRLAWCKMESRFMMALLYHMEQFTSHTSFKLISSVPALDLSGSCSFPVRPQLGMSQNSKTTIPPSPTADFRLIANSDINIAALKGIVNVCQIFVHTLFPLSLSLSLRPQEP